MLLTRFPLLVTGLVLAPLAFAQSTQSSILGTVTDRTGAAVSAASVQLRNEGTGATRVLAVNPDGDYRFPGLEAGLYEITITAAGFKANAQRRIDLASAQIKRIDATLEVGDVSTTISVEGQTAQLETESVTLSNVKTSRDFAQLPLSPFGRSWANVTNVTAGVQSASGYEVNGARATANNFTSDGISANDMVGSTNTANGFSGDIETFQEIKILTANSSAEYAQVAQFAGVSKQGTNKFHGSLYWGNFNSNFSARSWSDRQPPSFVNHNMFALNGGGPVVIPKVYNGKNKTFFFASYSGARYRIGNRLFQIVPTAGMREGNFSEFSGRIEVRDPLAGNTPFPNNTLPASRLSAPSKALQSLLYPAPNNSGQGALGVTDNYYADPGGRFDSDVYSFRVDHKISDRNLFFVRTGLTMRNGDTYYGGLNNGYGAASIISNIPGRSVVISDTHTFSPTMVNEVKAGLNRTFSDSKDANYGVDVQSLLGIQGIDNPSNDPAIASMPQFTFGGAIPVAASTGRNQNYQAQNTYQLIDNFSWFRGRHTLKFGGDVRRLQVNSQVKPLNLRGAYTFDDRLSGLAYANFLLGMPSSAVRGIARPNAYPRGTSLGFYVQDDIRLHQRVTLNVGLRYDYQTPWVEKFRRTFTFDPATGNMVTAGSQIPADLVPLVASTLPIVSAATAGIPQDSLMRSDGNNFSPRIGVAIRPFGDATTVIRAGYGIYTQIWPGSLALNQTGGPWQSTESFIIESPTVPLIQFPSPFRTTSQFSGIQSISGLSANFPNERTQQWNLSVGRQVLGFAIDLGYVGTRGMNIPYSEDLNLLQPSTTPFSAARRPYSRYNSATLLQTGGSSIYHGMTAQADRRMRGGLWMNVNYTLAKALTDVDLQTYAAASQQNQYARFLERSDDRNIRRQQLRTSWVYDLPVHVRMRAVGALTNGWQMAGIATLQTGARLSPTYANADPAGTGQVGGRPDRLANGQFDSGEMRDRIRNRMPIFDLAAFALPANNRGFYGNSGRYILTGPGQANWNLGVHKNWRLGEQGPALQFRWETFNTFNRANFSNPNQGIQSGAFGLVTTAGSGRSMLFGLRLDH